MSSKKHDLVKRVLFTNEEIELKVKDLASKINEDFKDREEDILFVGVLIGSIPFFSLLLKNIEFDCITDFCRIASFNGGECASSEPKLLTETTTDVKGKIVFIVEDIIDSGHTIKFLKDYYLEKGAKQVVIVTLLNKESARKADVETDYYAFIVENEFLIGFGLDYKERLRNLDYVAVCDTDKLKKYK